jgi:hypothetical protein
MDRLLARQAFEQGLVGPRMADRIVLEAHQAPEMDLLHAGLMRDAHEGGQLLDRLAQAGQPHGDARLVEPLARLHLGESPDIAENAREKIPAADLAVGGGIGGIERDAQFIEPGLGQLAPLLRGQQRAVGVEQHIGAAVLEVADLARQVLHQHRLADAVQHHPGDVGHLVDDARDQLPARVRRRLQAPDP